MSRAAAETDLSPLLLTAGCYPEDGSWFFYTPAGTVELHVEIIQLGELLRLLDGTRLASDILACFPEPLRPEISALISLMQEHGIVRPISRLYTLYYAHTEELTEKPELRVRTRELIVSPKWSPQPSDSLAARLLARKSTRSFSGEPLPIDSLIYVLWAMYGNTPRSVTDTVGTVPSAGGFYSLTIYVVILRRGEDLKEGTYVWDPRGNLLRRLVLHNEDKDHDRFRTALPIGLHSTAASCLLIITSSVDQVARKYGCQALKFVYLEAGHCLQNAYLATAEAKLSMVEVGQLNVSLISMGLGLAANEYFLGSALIGRAIE
jgi:SagB-type dehydrogenase family enzyme